jgi:hypothetical protein
MVLIVPDLVEPHTLSRITDMNSKGAAEELRDLASRARRLPPPCHRNPEAFHEARSELGKDIDAIATWLMTGKRPD